MSINWFKIGCQIVIQLFLSAFFLITLCHSWNLPCCLVGLRKEESSLKMLPFTDTLLSKMSFSIDRQLSKSECSHFYVPINSLINRSIAEFSKALALLIFEPQYIYIFFFSECTLFSVLWPQHGQPCIQNYTLTLMKLYFILGFLFVKSSGIVPT